MDPAADVRGNRLLAALADADGQRWRQRLERVDLKAGQLVYRSGAPQVHAYFPSSAIVSLSYTMESGACTEVALVGDEGIVGTSVFLDGGTTTSQGAVLIAGQGFRIAAQFIRDAFERSDTVRHLLLCYTQALITQMAQTAVCNRHHSLDQQLCRWLLLSLDRLPGNELVMTQELIANMLGVRREGVTEAALKLQKLGLIRYARGHITVLDRPGLAERTCECYEVVKKEYDRLLPVRLAS